MVDISSSGEPDDQQELSHTASDQQAGGVELEQPRTGALPLDDAAILQRQAAALEQVLAKACQSSRSSPQPLSNLRSFCLPPNPTPSLLHSPEKNMVILFVQVC